MDEIAVRNYYCLGINESSLDKELKFQQLYEHI